MARRGDRPESDDQVQDLEVWFLGPDGMPIEATPPRTTEDVMRTARGTVVTALDRLRHRRAAAGFRPGGHADRRDRRDVLDEVVVPVLIHPSVTTALAVERDLFSPPLAGMTVDDRTPETTDGAVTWPVTLRTGLLARRQATLRMQASPSAVLTVLGLIPTKRRPLRQRAFIRAGTEVMAQLSERLYTRSAVGLAAPSARSP